MKFYDRQGAVIDFEQFAELKSTPGYARIAETTVGNLWVSTVWLGRNHNWGNGAPLIFETMVFGAKTQTALNYSERYANEIAALAGHDRACAWAKDQI